MKEKEGHKPMMMFLVVRDRMHRHVPAVRVVAAIFGGAIFVIEYVEDTGTRCM